ncbi:MAG: dTMP kinase [Gammaproteobacteria bacterium]|nr:dTMP kinase [Gammaproteobacteria bacterium]
MTATTGKFITVEGSEGVGKSTNLQFIADCLQAAGKTVVMTREPGGTPIAEQIRDVLLASAYGSMATQCELLLMFAARADHLEQVILPALQRGDWVVCDRFIDASYAYQGAGRGMADRDIAALEQFVLQGLKPDLTILLDAPAEISTARCGARGVSDRFEVEEAEFFARVREKYRQRATDEPARIALIDASGSLAEVQAKIATVLSERL